MGQITRVVQYNAGVPLPGRKDNCCTTSVILARLGSGIRLEINATALRLS